MPITHFNRPYNKPKSRKEYRIPKQEAYRAQKALDEKHTVVIRQASLEPKLQLSISDRFTTNYSPNTAQANVTYKTLQGKKIRIYANELNNPRSFNVFVRLLYNLVHSTSPRFLGDFQIGFSRGVVHTPFNTVIQTPTFRVALVPFAAAHPDYKIETFDHHLSVLRDEPHPHCHQTSYSAPHSNADSDSSLAESVTWFDGAPVPKQNADIFDSTADYKESPLLQSVTWLDGAPVTRSDADIFAAAEVRVIASTPPTAAMATTLSPLTGRGTSATFQPAQPAKNSAAAADDGEELDYGIMAFN